MAVALVLLSMIPFTACGGSDRSSDDGGDRSTTSVDAARTTIAAGDSQACTLFVETVGLAGLVPRDSESWRDERERVLVDARREAELLRRVSTLASPDLMVAFDTVASYAVFVADALDASSSYEDASRRLEAFGDLSEVRTRDAEIDAWHDQLC